MSHIRFLLLSACFALVSLFSLAAQTEWRIADIRVESKGLTGRLPVLIKSELSVGEDFDSKSRLEAYLEEKRQLLLNTRLFDEVVMEYAVVDPATDPVEVVVTVRLKETWNLIVLPYAKYDNNDGLTASLRLRDYNFLGTMETLSLNLNYVLYSNQEDKSEFGLELAYKYNFRIGAQTFSLNMDQSASFFVFNGDSTGEEPYYLSTGIKLGTFFPTPILMFDRDRLNYNVTLYMDTNYNFQGFHFQEDEDLRKFNIGLAHGLGVKRINWTENYRNGYLFDLEQKYFYNFITEVMDIRTNLTMAYHRGVYPVQYSGRILGSINGFSTSDLGDNLRGIMDSRVEGMGGIFLNNNLFLTLFRLPPLMELQAGLLFDFGYAFGLTGGSEFQSPLYTGVGFEIVAFPYFAKSLYLRLSLAFNAEEVWRTRNISDDGNWEVFIGLGHYF